MTILIITNHHAFLNNSNECVDYFKNLHKISNDLKIFYDQSYFIKKDYSNELSQILDFKVKGSGLFFWKKIIDDMKSDINKLNKPKIYLEGLYSPFQKEIFFNLKPTGGEFYCYSALMPFFFQRLDLDNGKITN